MGGGGDWDGDGRMRWVQAQDVMQMSGWSVRPGEGDGWAGMRDAGNDAAATAAGANEKETYIAKRLALPAVVARCSSSIAVA